MAAPRPNGSIDIWNFVDNVTGVTVRKWLRDSWARRKIVALQQTIADIVVPTKTSQLQNDSGFITQADVPPGSTASSTTPLMDGTAAVGTENAFARGDHRHPTDTSRQAALSTAQMAAVNSGVTAAKVAEWDGITVPTKTSELTNDSGFVTASAIPTETSDLVNDSGFITAADIPAIPSKTSDLTNDSDFQTGTEVEDAISAEAGLMIPYGYCTIAAGTVAKTVTVSPAVTALTAGLCIAVKFQYANTSTNPTLNVNGLGAKAIKRYGTTAAGTSAAANWNANSVVILVYDGTYWQLADWNNTTYSGMSDAEYQAGTGTSNRLITPARLKAAIELHAPVQSVNGQTGAVTVNVPTKTSDLTNDSGFITSAPVTSVNTKTGAVTLSASDVGALPSSTVIPTKTSDLTNDSGYITSAPVQSVNGQTGTVNLDASDVGALPDSTVIPTVPTNVSAFNNDAGYLTSAPVTSVNGKAGAVSLDASDVGALPSSTAIPSKTSDLTNDSGFITSSSVPDASTVAPSMDGTGAAGSSADYARADHVHPHDTAKQDALSTAQLAAVNSGITADDLAVNDASVVCTATKIVPTLTNGTARNAYGGVYYYKIGSRVTVHVGVEGLTANTDTTLFTLPTGYHNTDGNYGFVGIGSSMSNYCRMRIDSSGIVRVSSSGSYGSVTAQFDVFG